MLKILTHEGVKMLKNFTTAITIALFLLGIVFTMKMCAEEPVYEVESFSAIKETDPEKFKMTCWHAYKYHKEIALDTFRDLEETSWMFPPSSDRDKATAFFQACIASFASADPRAKLMVIFTSLVASYGMVIIEQYHYMANQYYDAQYHLNVADFYLECALKYNP